MLVGVHRARATIPLQPTAVQARGGLSGLALRLLMDLGLRLAPPLLLMALGPGLRLAPLLSRWRQPDRRSAMAGSARARH